MPRAPPILPVNQPRQRLVRHGCVLACLEESLGHQRGGLDGQRVAPAMGEALSLRGPVHKFLLFLLGREKALDEIPRFIALGRRKRVGAQGKGVVVVLAIALANDVF